MSTLVLLILVTICASAFADDPSASSIPAPPLGFCPPNLPAVQAIITLNYYSPAAAKEDPTSTSATTSNSPLPPTTTPFNTNNTFEWTISVSAPINVPPSDSTSCSEAAYVSQYTGNGGTCQNALTNATQPPQPSPTGCVWWFATADASIAAIINISCDPSVSQNDAAPLMSATAQAVRIGEDSDFYAFTGVSSAVCGSLPTTSAGPTTTTQAVTTTTETSPPATTASTTTTETTTGTTQMPDTTTTATEGTSTTTTLLPPPPPTTTSAILGVCPLYIPPFEGYITQLFNDQQETYMWTISPTQPVNETPADAPAGTQSCNAAGYVSQYVPGGVCSAVASYQSSAPIPYATGCSYNFNDNGTRVMSLTLACDPTALAVQMGSTVTVEIIANVYYYLFTGSYIGVCPSVLPTTTRGDDTSTTTTATAITETTTNTDVTTNTFITSAFPTDTQTTTETETSSVETFTEIPDTTTQAVPTTTSGPNTTTTATTETGTFPTDMTTTSQTSLPTTTTTALPFQPANASFFTSTAGYVLVDEIIAYLQDISSSVKNVQDWRGISLVGCTPVAPTSSNNTCLVSFGYLSDAIKAVAGANSGALNGVYSGSIMGPTSTTTTVAPTTTTGTSLTAATTTIVTGTFPTATDETSGTSSAQTFTEIPFTTTTSATNTVPTTTTAMPTQQTNATFLTTVAGYILVDEIVSYLENSNMKNAVNDYHGITWQWCTPVTVNGSNFTCLVSFDFSSDATKAVDGANSGQLAGVYSGTVLSPTTTPSPTEPSNHSPSKTGTIVGVVVGVVVGVFILSAAVVYIRRKRQESQDGLYERINDNDSEIRSRT